MRQVHASRGRRRAFASTGIALAFATACAGSTPEPKVEARPEPAATAVAHRSRSAAAPPVIEQKAIERLNEMGAFLRLQQAFSLKIAASTDEILDTGQKIQLDSRAEIAVKRPNRLYGKIDSDRKSREFFFDGKTFTLYGKRAGYYATFAAPSTIAEVIAVAERDYDIELPLVDLFYWGTDASGVEAIEGAIDLGPSSVDGKPCEHFAFRQDDVDWQIWIERGDKPLPRKMVITTTSEAAQPQHVVKLDWNLSPTFDAATFSFVPPKDAKKIPFAKAERSKEP
jgi:hypothetical protein